MLRHVSILSFAVALACLALAAVAEAQECPPGGCESFPGLSQPPPLLCNFGRGASVEASPPKVVEDSSCEPLGVTSCLEWTYTYAGRSISDAAILVDSDVDTNPDPDSPDSRIIGTGVKDVSQVGELTDSVVTIHTTKDVSPGSGSALALVRNKSLSCLIAVPDNIVESPGVGVRPVFDFQEDLFGICTITLAVDPRGCPIPGGVTAVSSDPEIVCEVNEVVAPTINGSTFAGGRCGNRFTSRGNSPICSVWYCPNAFGGCTEIFYDKGSGECP